MPHIQKKYDIKDRIEYEINFSGRYGMKGEKRAKRKEFTKEQMKRFNQINKENRLRRTIYANFEEGDLFLTLKYPKGTRKNISDVKKDFRNFINRLKTAFKKFAAKPKYVYRIEIGKLGGIHIHMILNRIKGQDTDLIAQRTWKNGRVNFQSIYEYGGCKKLANYLSKKPDEDSKEYEQLNLFDEKDKKVLLSIGSSRNLVRPEPEVKEYHRRTVKKLVNDGPVASPGYYIEKESVVMGVNPYNGMTYIRYTEVRIKQKRRNELCLSTILS